MKHPYTNEGIIVGEAFEHCCCNTLIDIVCAGEMMPCGHRGGGLFRERPKSLLKFRCGFGVSFVCCAAFFQGAGGTRLSILKTDVNNLVFRMEKVVYVVYF